MAIRICNCVECLKDPPNLYGEEYWVLIAVFYYLIVLSSKYGELIKQIFAIAYL